MKKPMVHVSVPDVYGQRARAQEAADGIATIIGDRAEPWTVEIREQAEVAGWQVRVEGEGHRWNLLFHGDDETPETVIRQFRLNLRPYLGEGGGDVEGGAAGVAGKD